MSKYHILQVQWGMLERTQLVPEPHSVEHLFLLAHIEIRGYSK